MLVLKRREGQWLEVTHRSGDVLRMRFYRIEGGPPGRLDIAFDDAPRHFEIHRPERVKRQPWHPPQRTTPSVTLNVPPEALGPEPRPDTVTTEVIVTGLGTFPSA